MLEVRLLTKCYSGPRCGPCESRHSPGQVVARDSVARLRELMSQSSLEGVFAQLTQAEDTDAIAPYTRCSI